MDASNSMSEIWYRTFKPLGKVRRRVQDLRIPSFSYSDFLANGHRLDLSHNESSRLAVDCLLSRGLEGYHEVLKAEGEVDFLSELEKNYILQYGRDGCTDDLGESDDMDREFESTTDCQSCSRCSAVSTDDSSTVESTKDVKSIDPIPEDSSGEVFFQTDSRAAGMKDLVRQFIRGAKLALAIVLDCFSDPELLCDLLEASRKRNVSVHLLLDHLNLDMFVSMWHDLKLNSKNFPKVSVRSVEGQTYCARTGRKLTGQITESFIIADWTDVLTGSYSFSWLSWQVHHSFIVLIKGSSVSHFHQELNRLYSSSEPVPGFATFITVPQFLCLHSTSHEAQNDNTTSRNGKPSQTAWNEVGENSEEKATVKLVLESLEVECRKGGNQPVEKTHPGAHTEKTAPQVNLKASTQQVTECKEQSVPEENPQHAVVSTLLDAGSNVELLEMNQNRSHSRSDLPDQTLLSDVQFQLANATVTSSAEKNLMLRDPNHQHTASPTHGQHTTPYSQSSLKKVTHLNHPDLCTEGMFSQPWNRNMLAKHSVFVSGTNVQRKHWHYSLNFHPKVEFPCDPKLKSTPQQVQAKTGLQFPFTNIRGNTSRLQTKIPFPEITRHDEQHKQLKLPLHSHFNTESSRPKSAPAGVRAHLRPQLQADSRLFLPSVRAKIHLQPVNPQQLNVITPKLNWTAQNYQAAGPRAVSRHSSFSGAHVSEQVGWRLLQSRMNTSLGRSKSMTERCTAGFRATGLPPN